MANYEKSINHLQEIVGILNTVKNDSIVLKSLCSALHDVYLSIENTSEALLLGNAYLSVLEEVCNAKSFILSNMAISQLVAIYRRILVKAPGYAVRNVITTLLGICNHKNSTSNSRECVIRVIGEILMKRAFDCGSMITEVVQSFLKVLKSASDNNLRIACICGLNNILIGGESKIQDVHSEVIKTITKLVVDKSIEVRKCSSELIETIVKYSSGCVSVSADTLFGLTAKGLEDENPSVQDSFCRTQASIYVEQINAYFDAQEKAKIGLARGGSTDAPPSSPKKSSLTRGLSITKFVSSQKKTVVEEFTLKIIVSNLSKLIAKSTSTLRAAYISVLGYVINDFIQVIERTEYGWLLGALIGIFKEPSIANLPYDEKIFVRARLSHVFRNSVTFNLSEPLQLELINEFVQLFENSDQFNEEELQFVLGEVGHLVTILEEAAGAVTDNIHMALTIFLRHSSFGVRSSTAQVLLSLAHVAPALAARYVSNSLSNAQSLVKVLTAYDNNDASVVTDMFDEGSFHGSVESSSPSKRKTGKEMEQLQKMYCFHGHTLVIATLLCNESTLPSGFPKSLVLDLFEFGMSLLLQDILSVPPSQRHVSCSIVRAGSLIISSCLHLGYNMNRTKLSELLKCCDTLLKIAAGSQVEKDEDLLFELMIVEAAVVCISAMLWYCPDALTHEPYFQDYVIETLEVSYRTLKSKYQPKFRTHFRFRTLHILVLECYAWLPPASFPAQCQTIFVETLRVFRDSISAGYVCTCLYDILPTECKPLLSTFKPIPQSSYGLNLDILPSNENTFIVKLESYSTTLQKKESEAVLGIIGKEISPIKLPSFMNRPNWYQPSTPPNQIDARTIDSSIIIVAAIFSHQSTEYKIKAMQLFSQAITQCLSVTSATTQPAKKNFVTIKNVTGALSYIVRTLPDSFYDSSEDLSWFEIIIDRLVDIMSYIPNSEVRCAAASALSCILPKLANEGQFLEALIDNLHTRLIAIVNPALEKKGESMADYGAFFLALGGLWCSAPETTSASSGSTQETFQTKKGSIPLRDRILSTMLDWLRRVDTSVLFRSHGMIAFHNIVNHIYQSHRHSISSITVSQLNVSILPLAVNVSTVLDIHSSTASTNDDYEQLQVCILRVVCTLACLSLEIWNSFPSRHEFKDVAITCCRLWDSSREFANHPLFKEEVVRFVNIVCPLVFCQISSKSHNGDVLLSKAQILTLLRDVLSSRDNVTLPTLEFGVQAISTLITADCQAVFENGLDTTLFNLLDWSLGTAPANQIQSFYGLEIRSPYHPSSTDLAKLDLPKLVKDTILQLIRSSISNSPDQRIVYWVMYARSIGMNLRTSEALEDSGADNEDEQHADKKTPVTIANITTYQQFVVKFRDYTISKASDLPPSRVAVKAFALACGDFALKLLSLTDKKLSMHLELQLARSEMHHILSKQSIPASSDGIASILKAPNSSMEYIPCFAILFISDFVNFACAAASITIHDKSLLSLQQNALALLATIVTTFSDSIDPDINDSSSKILHQYTSQLLSTVRPAIAERYCGALTASTGVVVQELVSGGYITDVSALKRLVKSILGTYLQSYFTDEVISPECQITPAVRSSTDVSWEISILEYITHATNIAILEVMAQVNSLNLTFKDIQAAIKSSLEENSKYLRSIWTNIVRDCVRIRFYESCPADQLSFDLRRGGITFPPFVDLSNISKYYSSAYPTVLAALVYLPKFEGAQNELSDLELCSLLSELLVNVTQTNTNKSEALVVLEALSFIVGKPDNGIPLEQWTRVITIVHKALSMFVPSLANQTVLMKSMRERFSSVVVSLVGKGVSFYLRDETSDAISSVERKRLAALSWSLSLTILVRSLPAGLFDMFSDDNSDEAVLYLPSFSESLASSTLIIVTPFLPIVIETLVTSALTLNHDGLQHYCADLLLHLHTFITLTSPESSIQNNYLPSIIDGLKLLSSRSKAVKLHEVAGKLIESIVQARFSMPSYQSASGIKAAVDTTIGSWKELVNSVPDKASLIYPPAFIACLFDEEPSHLVFKQSLVLCMLNLIQTDKTLSSHLTHLLLPAVVTILSSYPSDIEQVLIKLLVIAFIGTDASPVEADTKESYLTIMLPTMCHVFRRSPTLNLASAQFGANALTHIARTYPELIRAQIVNLEADDRSVLQNAMRVAMELQASQAAAEASSGAAPPALKKIDLAKFKK